MILPLNRLSTVLAGLILICVSPRAFFAAEPLPVIIGVEAQPLAAQARRLVEAMDYLGSPFSQGDKAALRAAIDDGSPDSAQKIQTLLDRYCLLAVNINPEMRVKVAQGPARAELVANGWRQFLVKVHNESGTTAPLVGVSPNAASVFTSNSANNPSDRAYRKGKNAPASLKGPDLWLDLQMYNQQPLRPALSGLLVEYRIIQLYSRDAGPREAKIAFNVGQGTQDLGFRNEADILFACAPAKTVKLKVTDENGKPATAMFLIRDRAGHVYPSQAKRLAPDFGFHPQVYRADGEQIQLPEGTYEIEFSRGPESVPEKRTVKIGGGPNTLAFQVKRWIDPSLMGWWSGDHHIHAAGCAHYTNPTEGVHAPDMMRHCLGEDLKIGANLTWGPCFDYQKQFFTGEVDKVSQYPYLLRYDVEVSGFGSHRSGHLCLLRLKDQMYPGGDSDKHWPTLGLNTLRWAKKQGALVGPAHSGWGLEARPAGNYPPVFSSTSGQVNVSSDLPNYIVPPFNGIGANEYIVDVTHEVPGPDGKLVPAVDFISTVDTPYVWELNIWYHTLNVGFRTRISGETDFPCIYGERVGLGRSYVKLAGRLDYEDWCEGIRAGRNYVGDGRSHLIDFMVDRQQMGVAGSELRLDRAGTVKITAKAAALLDATPDLAIKESPYHQKPYWHIERARAGQSREVPVEVIVNGYPVATKKIVADGTMREVSFDVKLERSSWVALRILPSSHTNPIFVLVDGKPIRASKRSAEWCLKGVDQCWSQKKSLIDPKELAQAEQDYEHARVTYRKILGESAVD